jgi:hypothetical protein
VKLFGVLGLGFPPVKPIAVPVIVYAGLTALMSALPGRFCQ